MALDTKFEASWNRYEDFEVTVEKERKLCKFAAQFASWTEQLCNRVVFERDIVKITQAKVLLLDKYMDYRSYVPKSHRSRAGDTGHLCIFHIFELAFNRLRVHELSITPPMLFLPPPPPPQPQLPAIGLGLLENVKNNGQSFTN